LSGADPKTAFDPGGLLDGLKKALAERALNAEMDHHLAGENGAGNGRNGYGRKTVTTDSGKFDGRAAGSAGELRPATDCQISAPVSRLR
jgi:putative transposase